jgi:hypothetical protein
MDGPSSKNASGLPLLIGIGIDENCITQSIAFGFVKDRTEGSCVDFVLFVKVCLPDGVPRPLLMIDGMPGSSLLSVCFLPRRLFPVASIFRRIFTNSSRILDLTEIFGIF